MDAVPRDDPAFRERVSAYYDGLRRGLEAAGAEYVPLTTATPLVTALGSWLVARGRGEPGLAVNPAASGLASSGGRS